jgi:hypothetical protein
MIYGSKINDNIMKIIKIYYKIIRINDYLRYIVAACQTIIGSHHCLAFVVKTAGALRSDFAITAMKQREYYFRPLQERDSRSPQTEARI